MTSRNTKTKFAEAAFRTLTRPLARMPRKTALRLGGLLGGFVGCLWGSRLRFASQNIREAAARGAIELKESPRHTAIRSFGHLGKSFMDLIRIYHERGLQIIDDVEVIGGEYYQRALDKNRGVINITGHCGNWELMAICLARRFCQGSVVARRLNNQTANQIMEDLRSVTGNTVYYKEGAVRGILTQLRQKRNVGILMDQAVLTQEGCIIDFLGKPAWTTKMPAVLAHKTGAALVPVFMSRDEQGRNIVTIHPEMELTPHESDKEAAILRDTQRLSLYIDRHIAEHPDQWLWGHRRWKRAPDREPGAVNTPGTPSPSDTTTPET